MICEAAGPLAVFVSYSTDSGVWLKQELRTSALEFHLVQREVFRSAAIIPFRFPTIVEDKSELEEHLRTRSEEYSALLDKFASLVQMEFSVNNANSDSSASSGAEYLKRRQNLISSVEAFSGDIKQGLGPLVEDWRQRETKNGLRLFALVDRKHVAEFERMIGAAAVPSAFKVRVSGPWPVSEFIELS